MIGKTLAHYRITAAIGAGGMGEVYRATDTKLGRDVAIKILPPEVAQDPERLARFQREAHVLASLNHPNIAAIYGLEETDAQPFLALELVEGEDLKERLARGSMSVDEALEIAEQIAEALEEAHGKGIVHRDLKPANVKLTPEGKAKVLDFGLAKAWGGDAGSGGSSIDLSQSPTLARTGTLAGVILGTVGYMSPEQAGGKGVDKRADIWSFGVVLFEMLSGRSLFAGETPSEVMAAVIKEEPAWDRLPAGCPPAVTRLIRRCLRKKPRERLQDIGDARLEIQEVRTGASAEVAPPSSDAEEALQIVRRRHSRERRIWAAALLVAAGLASLIAYRLLTQVSAPRRAAHFVLETPQGLSAPDWGAPVVSPDGGQVVFAASDSDGRATLWTRPLDAPGVRPLAGTEGASSPFWSPDGGSVAFFAEGELRKLSLASGTVQRLCALPRPGPAGGTWAPDGTVLFATGGDAARLHVVPAGGGEARPLTAVDASRGDTGRYWPQLLPDGRRFLFHVSTTEGDSGLYVASLDRPGERRLVRSGLARSLYAPSGHLLFVRDGTLLAQPFDATRAELTGEPAAVSEGVATWTRVPIFSWGWFSVSPSGTLTYLERQATSGFELTWLDRQGARLGTVGQPHRYRQLALSPDERRVAVEITDGGPSDIWTIDLARGVASRLTSGPADKYNPVWSPDGREVAFTFIAGAADIRVYHKALQGNTPASPLGPDLRGVFPECWSSPANALLYVTLQSPEGQAFGLLSPDGNAEPETILKKSSQIDEPQVSPDGRWLAYASQESGQWEVYVQPFRQEGEGVRVSTEGGGQPRWRGDGRELFYVSPAGRLMAVDVRATGDRIEVGLPAALFAGVNPAPDTDHYAVTADGQRFLVPLPVGDEAAARIHVVTNWTSLLK